MNATLPTTKAQPNKHGVIWSLSKSGKIQIALKLSTTPGERHQVWGLYTGTHDLAPIAQSFVSETSARAYCNALWRNR